MGRYFKNVNARVFAFMFAFCFLTFSVWSQDAFLNQKDVVLDDKKSDKPVLNQFIDGLLRQPGFGLYADFSVLAAYYPSWSYSPWDERFAGNEVITGKQPFGAEMRGMFAFDIRVSPDLSFFQSVKLSIPSMKFAFYEFYADYILLDRVYFKIGKFDYSWGIGYANFRYTDIISQVPESTNGNPGDLYIGKMLFPVFISGIMLCDIEILTFTRDSFVNVNSPELNNFAVGVKLNFPQKWADMDIGMVYYKLMPLRSFFSLKTTLFKRLEIYSEVMASVDTLSDNKTYVSGSFGFYNDFFNGKFKINGEFFWSGEENAKILTNDNPLQDEKSVVPFIPGPNFAFKIDYKPGVLFNFRVGVQFRYALWDNSGQVVPGITIEPAHHLKIYIAMPLVVGTNSGKPYSYYASNIDKYNKPFSFIIALSLSGSWQFTRYR